MTVLFTISILALVALLWATIGIARHIHLVRLRRRRSRVAETPDTLKAQRATPRRTENRPR